MLLKLHSDTNDIVRKKINMDKEGDMKRAVDVLNEWTKMQPHFRRKEFPDQYLESFIIGSKGSIETAKKRLDKMCTIRTLLPQFFEERDASRDFNNLFNKMSVAVLPKPTRDHYRVFLLKAHDTLTEPSEFSNLYKYIIQMTEYLVLNDCIDSYLIVEDLTALDMVKFISKLNLVELKQVFTISMEAFSLKIKGIHMISKSKAIELLVTALKQILKPKVASRIHVHKSVEELKEIIEEDVLPVDFGGTEKSLNEIQDDWIQVLSSKDFMEYFRELQSACTDESLRPSDRFNEAYAGMPGTFRILSVD